jgi:DNA (cytosine-5)-methyltransferase 1
MQTRRSKLLAADLFAGAGGLSCGFLQAGNYEVVFANDIDSNAALTYQRNHEGVRFYSEPIEDLSADRIKRDTGLRK